MKRVVVIGSPGAGKTEFSRRLASLTGLPLIHLDLIYHDATKDYKQNRESWLGAVQTEITKPSWIIDGNYKSSFELRLPAADTIVFLDYPTKLSIFRAFKRRFQYIRKTRADMPDTWKEKLDWQLFWFIVRFNRHDAPNIRDLLVTYQTDKQIIVFRHPAQAEHYLRLLTES